MDESLSKAFDLSGRVAVVTGAGGGIGREAAVVFAAAGARVVIGDVATDGLFETVRLVEGVGGRAIAVPTDVRRRSEVDALVATAASEFGSVDVMANVAGIIRNNLVVDTRGRMSTVLRRSSHGLQGLVVGGRAAGQGEEHVFQRRGVSSKTRSPRDRTNSMSSV